MSFLTPGILLGALGIGIPIVAHLLNRFRFKVIDWGAMELLRRAVLVRERKLRLEDILLLLLRCLVILLAVLALARPVLNPKAGASSGTTSNIGVVIAIDASFSMGHKPALKSRFNLAVERAKGLLKTLRPGNPITLVLLGDRPHVLLRNVGYDVDRVDALLANATPLPERLELEASLDEMHNLMEELSTPIREFHLVTDAQAESWGDLSDKARNAFQRLAKLGNAFVWPVLVENSENVAITRFELRSGHLRRGEDASFDAEIKNFGSVACEDVTVALLVDGKQTDQFVVNRVEPGQTVIASFYLRFEQAGCLKLTAQIGSDPLLIDNTRYAVVEVSQQTRVLLVQAGKNGAPAEGDEAFFVQKMLEAQSGEKADEGLAVDPISWVNLTNKSMSNYQVVVLVGVPFLAPESATAIQRFVKDGGGLIVFPGNNIQAALYTQLQDDGIALLPGEWGEKPVVLPAELPIEPRSHPVTRVLGGLSEGIVRQSKVKKLFSLQPREGSRSIVGVSGREEPVVIEKSLGRGKVIQFAFAMEPEWTNTVVETSLSVFLIHEAVTYLCRQPHEQALTVSQSTELPLALSADQPLEAVIVRSPGGESQRLPYKRRDGLRWVDLSTVEKPGFYEMQTEPPTKALSIAVNVDTRESNVQPLDETVLAEKLSQLGVSTVLPTSEIDASLRQHRVGLELRKPLMIAALTLLFIEGMLARWFTRKAPKESNTQGAAVPHVPTTHAA